MQNELEILPGPVIAVGGGMEVKGQMLVLSEILRLAGGSQARFVLITTASSEPDAGQEEEAALLRLGMQQPATYLQIKSREMACDMRLLPVIQQATCAFLCGGVQLRLTSILGGTPVEEALHALQRQGGVVAGTSAGAAALSRVMIAGGRRGLLPQARIAQLAPGLDLVSEVIIDQHFRQRDRLGRLLYAVALHPGYLGVGIDENTAAILHGEELRVVGRGSVTIVDADSLQATNVAETEGGQPIALSGLKLHVLTHGCSFNLAQRQAVLAAR